MYIGPQKEKLLNLDNPEPAYIHYMDVPPTNNTNQILDGFFNTSNEQTVEVTENLKEPGETERVLLFLLHTCLNTCAGCRACACPYSMLDKLRRIIEYTGLVAGAAACQPVAGTCVKALKIDLNTQIYIVFYPIPNLLIR